MHEHQHHRARRMERVEEKERRGAVIVTTSNEPIVLSL